MCLHYPTTGAARILLFVDGTDLRPTGTFGKSGGTSARVIALSGFARSETTLTQRRYTLHIPKKILSLVFVVGKEACFNASTFLL